MSFFCPQCNNLYTKITPTISKQLEEKGETDTPNTVSSFNTTSNKTEDKQKGGGSDTNVANVIKKILAGEIIDDKDISGITIEDLAEQPSYKKLTGKQKEAVYNIINDKLPKKLPSQKKESDKKAYFECSNCGYSEPVKPGTLLLRRVRDTFITKDFDTPVSYGEFTNASYIPITRAYICPNKQCKSHSDHEKREAVMYRQPNSMKIEYVCKTCSFHWV
jgi:hypothetical protein